MTNQILRVSVRDRSPAPASAEVWVTVLPERRDAGTEVRGRLTGPRCAYAATIEVAYPLRPLGPSTRGSEPAEGITLRSVIPEASFWEPESPFLYEGPVELWQDGACCDRTVVRCGLRTVALGPRGLRVNGRPLTLRGREAPGADEGTIRAFHDSGVNLLVCGAGSHPAIGTRQVGNLPHIADIADRVGLFILGRLPQAEAEALSLASALAAHPCGLGCLVPADAGWLDQLPPGMLVGVELQTPPASPLSDALHFVAGTAELAVLGRPLLLHGSTAGTAAGVPVLGSVAG
jgi:hypothetical protein